MTDENKPTSQEAQEATQTNELNINDLNAFKSIIEVTTQRGAFKPAELEAVGKVYNKLTAFLDAIPKKD